MTMWATERASVVAGIGKKVEGAGKRAVKGMATGGTTSTSSSGGKKGGSSRKKGKGGGGKVERAAREILK